MSAAATTIIAGVGAAASVGGAIAGASSSRKARKSAERQANQQNSRVAAEMERVRDFEFRNVYEGIGEGQSYDVVQQQAAQLGQAGGYQAATGQAGTLGPAAQTTAQGYNAGQVSVRNLAAGADFLSNPFANLQVGTAAAELQGRQTDRALAQSLESGAITGAGGATALAQAAVESKAGISADVQRQELQNAQLRAQGQQTLEQGLLAQSNLGNQFAFEQDRFNVGQANQAAAFTASAQNQANQFNASAANQFAQTQFGAENQFALANLQSQNQASQFNVGAQNQFALQQAGF